MKLKTYAKFFLAAKSPAAKIQTLNKIKNYLAKFNFEENEQKGKICDQIWLQSRQDGFCNLEFRPKIWHRVDGERDIEHELEAFGGKAVLAPKFKSRLPRVFPTFLAIIL